MEPRELLPEYFNAEIKTFEDITYLGKCNIDHILSKWKNEQEALVRKINRIDMIRKQLEELNTSEQKPILPCERPHNWFKKGDRVVCYMAYMPNRLIQKDWAYASVKRDPEGIIELYYEEKVHSGEYNEGHGGCFGNMRPDIMLEWEFEYLTTHPDYMRMWVESAIPYKLPEFNSEQLISALTIKEM